MLLAEPFDAQTLRCGQLLRIWGLVRLTDCSRWLAVRAVASPMASYVSGSSLLVHGGGEAPAYIEAVEESKT